MQFVNRNRKITFSKGERQFGKAQIAKSSGEKIFDTANVVLMAIIAFTTIYPFWYVLVMSLNEGSDAALGPIWLWPRKFTLANYEYVLQYRTLWSAALVTVGRCIFGALFSVIINMLAAYSTSKRFLPGRKIITFFFMMPMFVGGTIVSNFLVYIKLGLMNNFLVYVIPGAFGFFTMVMMRTSIDTIPAELEESAMLDGANYFQRFCMIILPLSKPIMAAFTFFAIVGGWLDLYTTLIYITKKELWTLQMILYQVISSSEAQNMVDFTNPEAVKRMAAQAGKNNLPTPEVIRMAVMVVVTFPILFVYPFFQRFFVKGMMVGAIKA